uniref:Uncharacterized protein n=1 Tax=Anopheles quadriannulatus TaxID=34691 RepID=A0A182XS85_ANOQN
ASPAKAARVSVADREREHNSQRVRQTTPSGGRVVQRFVSADSNSACLCVRVICMCVHVKCNRL